VAAAATEDPAATIEPLTDPQFQNLWPRNN
jgi:hypothetical protein